MVAALVLVHGSAATSKMWNPVLGLLAAPVLAVDLPGRRYKPADLADITMRDWVASVVQDVRERDLDNVVLAAHSGGGVIIPGVAAALPERVRHLVFLASPLPAEGKRPVDYTRPDVRQAAEYGLARRPTAGKTLSGLEPGEPPIDTELELIEMGARLGAEAAQPMFEPFSWSGVPDIPRTYVRTSQDRILTPEFQDEIVAALKPAEVLEVDTGHFLVAKEPAIVAQILNDIAARY